MSQTDDLSASELRSVMAAIPDVVVLIAEDRTVRFVNQPRAGYSHEDVIGIPALDFVAPDFREEYGEVLESVFETGEPAEYEVPIEDADGETEWHAGTLTPLSEDGRVTSVVVVSTNVTERRHAEEEAERLRRLVPVCSWCKRIRDDEGYWGQLEDYIEESTDSRVSHGMCPNCQGKMLNNGVESA